MFSQRRSHYWSQQSRTFFFKGFSAKQQKKPKKAANYSVIEQNALSDKHPKMTGQNDRPDESLTGQAHDQAGHCPLTGRYFEPWDAGVTLSRSVAKLKFLWLDARSLYLERASYFAELNLVSTEFVVCILAHFVKLWSSPVLVNSLWHGSWESV